MRWLAKAQEDPANGEEGAMSPVVTTEGGSDVRIGALGSGAAELSGRLEPSLRSVSARIREVLG